MSDDFRVRFWGVRGSVPVSGPEFDRTGGDTTCVEMRCGGEVIVVDLGTGARRLGAMLAAERPRRISVLLSHGHYDHVIGLPFFAPLFDPEITVEVASAVEGGTEALVRRLLSPPLFPIGVESFRARLTYRDLPADGVAAVAGATVRTAPTRHAGVTTAFRIEFGGRSAATVFDHEAGDRAIDDRLVALTRDADLAIYDATWGGPHVAEGRGYGHSRWDEVLDLGSRAGVRRIALSHHHPSAHDEGLARLEDAARRRSANAFVARAGDRVDLSSGRLDRCSVASGGYDGGGTAHR